MSEQTRAIIDYANDDDGVQFRDALYSAIQNKVMAHLETHKQKIASTLITPQEQPVEEPIESGETESEVA